MNGQMDIFSIGKEPLKIKNKIRLIELFAGYGSQALSLKYLGVPFEHHRICEWAVPSIQAYKDLHFTDDNTDYSKDLSIEQVVDFLVERGISTDYNKPSPRKYIERLGNKARTIYNNIIATNNLVSVCNVKGQDLEITETDKYTYILTYSFPCQDLSNAGLKKGMEKGSGTRSGLLWEVERILSECENKPHILLMENVPDVIGEKNRKSFDQWVARLDDWGYYSKWQVINGTDFEMPQHRKRCFMVSVLGDYYYQFPYPNGCTLRLKDLLEHNVEEKYYLSEQALSGCLNTTFESGRLENRIAHNVGITPLCARDYKGPKLVLEPIACEIRVDEGIRTFENNYMGTLRTIDACGCKHIIEPQLVGGFGEKKSNGGTQWYQQDRVYSTDTVAMAHCASIPSGSYNYLDNKRVRKLTPREAFRLMGVSDEDFDKVAQNQSNSSLYHLAGDSIITNCLMAIFKEML